MATFYAKIVTANEFLMIIMVMIEVQKVEADNGTVCEPGTTFLNDACFGLVDVAAGPVSYWDAEEKCADKITEGKPVSVRNKVSVLRKLSSLFCRLDFIYNPLSLRNSEKGQN